MGCIGRPICVLGLLVTVSVPSSAWAQEQGETAHGVWVHIDGPRDAELQEDSDGDGTWTTVCSGPCDRLLPAGKEYRIDGESMRSSTPFGLAGQPSEHLTLKVDAASSGLFTGGVVLVPVGLLTALVGGLDIFVGQLNASGGSEVYKRPNQNLTAGAVTIGVGAALVGLGIAIVTSATTRVSQYRGATEVGRASPDETWRFLPSWRSTEMREPALAPMPIVSTSLWTGRF
jgi:hypothetical protein